MLLEDGTDDPHAPWLQVDARHTDVLIEFGPDAVTARTFDGTALFAASYDTEALPLVLDWFTQFSSAAGASIN